MRGSNLVKEKSYDFALQIIKLTDDLYGRKEFIFANQILKAGTSVGANTEEALGAQSTKDFLSKLSIAYKEAREVNYWLRLLRDSKKVSIDILEPLIQESESLIKIIAKIRITTQKTNNKS